MLQMKFWIFSAMFFLPLLENGAADSQPVGKPKIVVRYLKRKVKEYAATGVAVATLQVMNSPPTVTSCILSGSHSHLFSLRQQNPVFYAVVLRRPLDYEREQKLNVDVMCQGRGMDPIAVSTAKIRLEVLDENDHQPMIRETRFIREIQENARVDTLISLIKVFDPDSGRAGKVYCSVSSTPPNSVLLINRSPNIFQLKTARVFDRETIPSVSYTIRCSDDGVPVQRSSLRKVIEIGDVDDNHPVFPKIKYITNVMENGPIGMQILHLRAFDNDLRNLIQYKITSKNLPFRIDNNRGVIYTTRRLDRERRHRYDFRVIAVSGAKESKLKRSATAIVQVRVMDQNDNIPVFPQRQFIFKVNETQRTVGRVWAIDADEGKNAIIEYRIDGNVSSFSINKTTGIIHRDTSRKPIGRGFNFTVSAINLRYVSKVKVSVIFPHLRRTTVSPQPHKANKTSKMRRNKNISIAFHYWFYVDEDAPAGTKLGKIVATGAENITYHLQGKEIKWLKLDNVTGVLSTATEIDRETMNDANISVMASYLSANRNTTRQVMVSINDINDCTPQFKTNHLTVSIPEGYHNSSIINGTLASDCDTTSPNNNISYRLRPSKNAKFFEILKDGRLKLKNGTFDREKNDAIKVILEAKDGGSPERSSAMTVTIKLIDVNDNAPLWMFPFSNETVMYVRKSTPPGAFVAAVVARDMDTGKNGVIVFDFVKPAPDLPFKIDRQHGIIKTSRVLTKKDIKPHQIVLQAMDLGTPSKQAVVMMNILVTKIH